jgi:HEPN domain-containing protein
MTVVNEWLKFAGEDLAAAEVLLNAKIFNLVLFHSQQCVEKSLKALILFEGKNPPKTHQLSSLVLLVSGLSFEPFRKGYEVLDQIYMPSRYPDALPGTLPDGLPNRNQAMEALQTAREIFTFIQPHLSTPHPRDPLP